jgi:hypothetical protein
MICCARCPRRAERLLFWIWTKKHEKTFLDQKGAFFSTADFFIFDEKKTWV